MNLFNFKTKLNSELTTYQAQFDFDTWTNKETHLAVVAMITPESIDDVMQLRDANDVKALLIELGEYNSKIDCNDIFNTLSEEL